MNPARNSCWRPLRRVGKYRIKRIKLKERRRYDCGHYGECLTYAAKHHLGNLPCDKCERYERRLPSMLDDLEGIVELWQTVFWDQGMQIFD